MPPPNTHTFNLAFIGHNPESILEWLKMATESLCYRIRRILELPGCHTSQILTVVSYLLFYILILPASKFLFLWGWGYP